MSRVGSLRCASTLLLTAAAGLTTWLAVPTEVCAEREYIQVENGLGFDIFAIGLGVARISENGTLEASKGEPSQVDFDQAGQLYFFRLRSAGFTGETRFGGKAGIEVDASMGWFSSSAVAGRVSLEEMPAGRFWTDATGSLLLAPVWGRNWRVAAAFGVGVSTDVATWAAGLRAQYAFATTSLSLRADYRPGRAHRGAESRELRAGIDWSRGDWALVFDTWLGQTQDGDALAPRARALRGDYRSFALSIEERW